jgi:hypothetical protein
LINKKSKIQALVSPAVK